jgi:hypothetical protein
MGDLLKFLTVAVTKVKDGVDLSGVTHGVTCAFDVDRHT